MSLNQRFDAGTLPELRRAVLAEALAAGMPRERAADLVLAVHELAANAVRYGGGAGRVQMQVTGRALCCQVSDDGRGDDDGRTHAEAGGVAGAWLFQPGHGLSLVRSVADHLTIEPGPAGSLVTAMFDLPYGQGAVNGQARRIPLPQCLADGGGDQ
jgi:anti-sigma regulatory factor (Ser/Thr protein kinase)